MTSAHRTMTSADRVGLAAVLGVRIAYGVALVLEPARLTRRWLGPLDDPATVALRGLGMREASLHGLALISAARSGPVRPFLAASIVGDLTDIVATAKGRRGLPTGSTPATLVVAGASAAISAGVAWRAGK